MVPATPMRGGRSNVTRSGVSTQISSLRLSGKKRVAAREPAKALPVRLASAHTAATTSLRFIVVSVDQCRPPAISALQECIRLPLVGVGGSELDGVGLT